ncbi:MAG: glycosyltransferase [Spirochaetes bacterium]|nr:glycosyltransferase [Spirochaetota bacterium]
MNIAFFVEVFYPEINGVITSTLDLARNLSERGHKVLLVVPSNKHIADLEWIGKIRVVKVASVPTFIYPGVRWTWPWSPHLFHTLHQEGIEILHFTGPWTLGWSAILYGKMYTLPVIQTFHTMLNEDTYLQYLVKLRTLVPIVRAISWWYFGLFIRHSDLITTPSRFAGEVLKERFPQKEIYHISNGIDTSLFKNARSYEELRREYPFYHRKTFLFVGRIGLEKSIDVLIQGFSRAIHRDKEIQLVLIGDGPNRKEMETLAQALGVQDSVKFLGKIPHQDLLTSGLIHYARAFVTASVTENQPMTVIEAICCGLPLILPKVPSMEELSEGNALFFPAGDMDALGERILQLAEDDSLFNTLTEASRRMAARFDGAQIAQRFEEFYREALNRKGKKLV